MFVMLTIVNLTCISIDSPLYSNLFFLWQIADSFSFSLSIFSDEENPHLFYHHPHTTPFRDPSNSNVCFIYSYQSQSFAAYDDATKNRDKSHESSVSREPKLSPRQRFLDTDQSFSEAFLQIIQ